MSIEHASIRAVPKPWGRTDLRPWSDIHNQGAPIGELWFQRPDSAAHSDLLLKLLFTTQPLSIQVHPADEFARSIGLPHGKAEAWYVLTAAPGARIAVGLKRELKAHQLRAAIADGSIVDLVKWTKVSRDDAISIPGGTIHSIGAGLVIAEIQQRSEATFRLFDFGRRRELHAARAVAAAHSMPAPPQMAPQRLTAERTQVAASQCFALEHIRLRPKSTWEIDARQETWLLVLEGSARIGPVDAAIGDAVFVKADRATATVGAEGLTGLMAYVGGTSDPGLLVERNAKSEGSPTSIYEQATLAWGHRSSGELS